MTRHQVLKKIKSFKIKKVKLSIQVSRQLSVRLHCWRHFHDISWTQSVERDQFRNIRLSLYWDLGMLREKTVRLSYRKWPVERFYRVTFHYFFIPNFEIPKYWSFYVPSFQMLTSPPAFKDISKISKFYGNFLLQDIFLKISNIKIFSKLENHQIDIREKI